MHAAHRRLAVTMMAFALLAGCGADVVQGPPSPPDDFGARETALFGCPDLQGLYAWPPEAGEFSNGINRNEQPWAGGKPAPIGRGNMQVLILEDSQRLTMLSRDRPADGNTDPGLRRAWGYSEHDSLACRDSMLDSDDEEIGSGRDFGCEGLRRGFRLARMEDGALAVGIRKVAYGCSDSIIRWGDVSKGEMKTPDRVYWRWSKLRRIGDAVVPASGA